MLLVLSGFLACALSAWAYPDMMTCADSQTWLPSTAFGEMGIASYSASTTGCQISISPNVVVYSPNQEFTVTIKPNAQLSIKTVIESAGSGAIVLATGTGGRMGNAAKTCVDYRSMSTSARTFSFRASATVPNPIHIRALCGDSNVMHVAPQITLTADFSAPPSLAPTTAAPTTWKPTVFGETRAPTPVPTQAGSGAAGTDQGGFSNAIPLKLVLVAHILIMLLAFGLCMPWAVQLPLFNNTRYSTRGYLCGVRRETWVSIHLAMAVLSFLLCAVGFATGYISVTSEEHFESTHTQFGLAAMVLCCVQVVFGATRSCWPAARFAGWHFVLGFIVIALGFVSLLTGVVELEEYTNGLPYMFENEEGEGLTGEVGFRGAMGIVIIAICSLQIAMLVFGLVQRLFQAQFSDSSNGQVAIKLDGSRPQFSLQSVNASQFLFIYQGKLVVDVRDFAAQHPGGHKVLLQHAGKDITASFEQQGHSNRARQLLASLIVGELDHASSTMEKGLAEQQQQGMTAFLTGANAPKRVRVAERFMLSDNMIELKLEYRPTNLPLGLPIGKHVIVFAKTSSGEEIQRKYTPVEQGLGWFRIMVKIYRACPPDFPCEGKMGALLESARVGDWLTVAGPVGLEEYLGNGRFKTRNNSAASTKYTDLLCIAGGSGITPMLQLANAILANPQDTTMIHLLFSNSTIKDVVLQSQLEAMEANFPKKFRVWFTLSAGAPPPGQEWAYSTGRVSLELLQQRYAALPRASTLAIVCGPSAFAAQCQRLLRDARFENVVVY